MVYADVYALATAVCSVFRSRSQGSSLACKFNKGGKSVVVVIKSSTRVDTEGCYNVRLS